MKKSLYLRGIFIFLMISAVMLPLLTLNAQQADERDGDFSLELEIRPRFELRNGFKRPINEFSNAAAFTEQRSRMYLNYTSSDLDVNLTLQDVRVWGNHNQIYKNDPALTNLYEAWGRYRINPMIAVKAGRQALNYDNARFMGNLNWAQQGRSHDALLLEYRQPESPWTAHLGFTLNQASIFEPGQLTGRDYPLGNANNKSMQFIWLNRSAEASGLSILLHNDVRQVPGGGPSEMRQTAGLNGHRAMDELTLRGEFYYQFGKDIAGRDVSAYLLNAELSYQGRYTLGADWLSGTELDEADNTSFAPLYGTNHKFYGYMDYFYVGNPHAQPGNTNSVGLINIYQKYARSLGDGWSFGLHVHEFISPVEVFDADGTSMSSYLGTEADMVLSYRPRADVAFTFGYSQMFKTDTMDRIKGSQNSAWYNSWAWVMLQFRPTLL